MKVLRTATGLASGYADSMCRRGSHPQRHYVCVPCRASFKKWALPERVHICPHCRNEQLDAGQDLPVPKRSDDEGWRVLQTVLDAGVTFHSSCCEGPGWRPRSLYEAKARIAISRRYGIPVKDALTTADIDAVAKASS